jgi:ferrous iron transport protein B
MSGSSEGEGRGEVPGRREREELLVGIAGQPNVGKTTVFNLLTGLAQHVGNWPGKTIERKLGYLSVNGTRMRVVDLPGAYSLTANSEEERISRDFVIHERPDVLVMVADASALERNLYLLAELLLLPAPVILALNMTDVAESEGIRIEPHVLEAALGIPVVPMVARRSVGLPRLREVIERVVRGRGFFSPRRPEITSTRRETLHRVLERVRGLLPDGYPDDWVAVKLLEGDDEVTAKVREWMPAEEWAALEDLLRQNEDAILDVVSSRYEWIARLVRAAVTRPKLGPVSLTDRIDRVALHPVGGLAVLGALFALVFWLTYAVAAPMQNWLDVAVVGGVRRGVASWASGWPDWLASLVSGGILGGAGVVLTFLPILAVFFAALGALEDTGYLARAAFVMDRFMHRLGLHGRSTLPLFLGFGCNVPAVLGSRVIDSRRGRLLTILLAPLVPCSARFAILAFLTPAFFGSGATLVAWSLVLLNLLVLAGAGVVLNRFVLRGERAAFIMELPLYHVPSHRTIGHFVWNNTWAFVKNAGSIILVFSVAVWALSSLPPGDVEQSVLARFGHALSPVGSLMGMDWRMVVALLSSFVAKENAIATLGVLYGGGGEAAGLADVMAAAVPPAAALAFLVVTMLFIPCVATMAVIRKESASWGWTAFSVGLLLAVALTAGIVVYQGARLLGWGV